MDFGAIGTRVLQLFGASGFRTTLTANPTADRILQLPDKPGTIATIADISVSPTLLFANHNPVTITGTTVETTFAGSNFTIPANTLQVGDVIFLNPLWAVTPSANNNTLRILLDTTIISEI